MPVYMIINCHKYDIVLYLLLHRVFYHHEMRHDRNSEKRYEGVRLVKGQLSRIQFNFHKCKIVIVVRVYHGDESSV